MVLGFGVRTQLPLTKSYLPSGRFRQVGNPVNMAGRDCGSFGGAAKLQPDKLSLSTDAVSKDTERLPLRLRERLEERDEVVALDLTLSDIRAA